MQHSSSKLFVLNRTPADADSFITFWAKRYKDPRESMYDQHIGKPLTPEGIRDLYFWKSGGKLFTSQQASVEQNYINRRHEIVHLHPDMPAKDFLNQFSKGGAIWRIFWLHLWQPDRYPIFDQHVWRAMHFIEHQQLDEISELSCKKKVNLYLNDYLPWQKQFSHLDQRQVDQALWTLGKFIKASPDLFFEN